MIAVAKPQCAARAATRSVMALSCAASATIRASRPSALQDASTIVSVDEPHAASTSSHAPRCNTWLRACTVTFGAAVVFAARSTLAPLTGIVAPLWTGCQLSGFSTSDVSCCRSETLGSERQSVAGFKLRRSHSSLGRPWTHQTSQKGALVVMSHAARILCQPYASQHI